MAGLTSLLTGNPHWTAYYVDGEKNSTGGIANQTNTSHILVFTRVAIKFAKSEPLKFCNHTGDAL